jgi:hypothetical protein
LLVQGCRTEQQGRYLGMDTLYHYTSLAGFLGITTSKSVWATDCSFLNDASEFQHGLGLAIGQVGNPIMDPDAYYQAFQHVVGSKLMGLEANDIFVSSFSEQPDLLSQWRGYCPSGAGLCLGVDAPALAAFCIKNGYQLHKCLYDPVEQNRKVHGLVDECRTRFHSNTMAYEEYARLPFPAQALYSIDHNSRMTEGEGKPAADEAADWLCDQLANLVPLFKNPSFQEEHEWRVVAALPPQPIQFRLHSSYLAPYIELPIFAAGRAALREVIVGPNPNQSRCARSIKMALSRFGFHDTEVKTSKLPFNSW